MYVKIQCPSCDRGLKVSEEMAGTRRVCPYCKGTIVVPSVSPLQDSGGGFNIDLSSGKKKAGTGPELKTTVGKAPAQQTSKASPKSSAPKSKSGDTDASNVSLIVSGFMGLGGAILIYALLLPLHLMGFNVATKFWDLASIGINFPTTLLMCWCFAILFLKWRKLKRQKSAMLMDLLPTEISREITIDTLDKFRVHIRGLPNDGSNILINRVLRGIEHFRVRKSAAETVTMMESQSAIDASNVAGSYTIVKVFIWAMPILGFIGTVMGVSNAVSGLSATLASSSGTGDIGPMMDSMKSVFSGLGTAFDTTLLALIMSLIVKIPASALQKSEDDLITVVDEYCNENLLRRLNDGREGGAERSAENRDASVFREAVESALGTHHAELEKWIAKLDAIGGQLTSQVAEGWSQVNEKMKDQQEIQLKKFQQQHTDQASQLQDQLHEMGAVAMGIQQSLSDLTEQAAGMQQQVSESMSGSATALESQFAGLERGLNSLSGVLGALGEQQVVVQQVQTPPAKRGWFK